MIIRKLVNDRSMTGLRVADLLTSKIVLIPKNRAIFALVSS